MIEKKVCPFSSPDFNIRLEDKCPVCGVKGYPFVTLKEIDEACVEGLFGDRKEQSDEY